MTPQKVHKSLNVHTKMKRIPLMGEVLAELLKVQNSNGLTVQQQLAAVAVAEASAGGDTGYKYLTWITDQVDGKNPDTVNIHNSSSNDGSVRYDPNKLSVEQLLKLKELQEMAMVKVDPPEE